MSYISVLITACLICQTYQVSHQLGSLMDLFSTVISLAGGRVPTDRILDGIDLSSVLFSSGKIIVR